MNITEIITQMAQDGFKAKDIAKVTGLTPNAVHTRLSRLGLHLKKGTKCREVAEYSAKHGVDAACEKFGVNKNFIYQMRSKYL